MHCIVVKEEAAEEEEEDDDDDEDEDAGWIRTCTALHGLHPLHLEAPHLDMGLEPIAINKDFLALGLALPSSSAEAASKETFRDSSCDTYKIREEK